MDRFGQRGDPTESHWLRQAKIDLLRRDPVDAINDAEALAAFATKRFDALMKGGPP